MWARTFDTGATRDTDSGKYDYEGFLNPLVLARFAAFMHKNRVQSDGTLRSGDNWQKGWSRDVSIKSLLRHVVDLWLLHRGYQVPRPEDGQVPTVEECLGAILFNVEAYWLQHLRETSESSGIVSGQRKGA